MPVTLVLGTFDGVHRGHAALIQRARTYPESVIVVTFDRHPLSVINHGAPPLILTLSMRDRLLELMGVDQVVSLTFDETMANMTAKAFVDYLCYQWNVRRMIVGFNYRFGRGAEGTPEKLMQWGLQYGFEVSCEPAVVWDGQIVSSTAIRQAIMDGNMPLANDMLGRAYLIEGRVTQGKQLGRTLGFPTLNVVLPASMVCPQRGVYTTAVYDGQQWMKAVSNVGVNPTVDEKIAVRCESYLFHPDEIPNYGDCITVAFFEHTRMERRYASVEALREGVEQDKKTARAYHETKEKLYKAWLPW